MRKGSGRLDVFTYKEGLLASAAHDLHFVLDDLSATLEGEVVRAEIPLAGLRLIGPVEGGVTHPERYDPGKRAEVERTMNEQVLRTSKHPVARFAGRAVANGAGFGVDGTLELAGQQALLRFDLVTAGPGEYRGHFEIHPTRWGIAPYKALLGAIRLKDLIRIELALREA
jgi:hypothetical protein